jgi:hypothetical protein
MEKDNVAAKICTLPRILGSFESHGVAMQAGRIDLLRALFEREGVEFVPGGVKMRDRISEEAAPPTPEQCRAARGLLVCSMEHLALHAGLSPDVVFNLERKGRIPFRSSADKLLAFFAAERIELLPGGARDLQPERRSEAIPGLRARALK